MEPISLSALISLFGTMFVLALLPSPSVFAVVARSLSAGLIHGVLTATGILVGDFVFILVAIGGLAAIADSLTILFELVKYLGAAYLSWLGINPWRAKADTVVRLCLSRRQRQSFLSTPQRQTAAQSHCSYHYGRHWPTTLL